MIVERTSSRVRTIYYRSRRVLQTPRAFANWPDLIAGMVREETSTGPDVLRFQARTGQTITIPNAPGARVPVYEILAEDCYHLGWFLDDLVNRPIHVLDIGAHVGTFATHLASIHPSATVDCFEPSPDTAGFLRSNVGVNGFGDRIEVHQQALAARQGHAVLDLQGAGSGHNHLAFADRIDGAAVRVPATTFDAVVAAARAPVELVKIDCEGGEYGFVYASSARSWADVQRVVLEYHTMPGESWEELRAWFAAAGLHVVRDDQSPVAGTAWLSRTPLRDQDPPARSAVVSSALKVRRVLQTPEEFANWSALLVDLARRKAGRGPDQLTFETRSGQRITTPDAPGVRVATYEARAESGSRWEWFLQGLRGTAVHVVDLGAGDGAAACRLAELLPGARITCFEPDTTAAGYLRRNLEQNGLVDRVAVLEDTPDLDVLLARSAGPTVVRIALDGAENQLVRESAPESWGPVERVVLAYRSTPDGSWPELRAWFARAGLHLVAHRPHSADHGLAWLARGFVGFPES